LDIFDHWVLWSSKHGQLSSK